MASKRDFDEEEYFAADGEEQVPAKKGRLEENIESNLGTDLPSEDEDDVSYEPDPEGREEYQDVVSVQSNESESDKSDSIEEIVDNDEESGNVELNPETVEYCEEDGNTESNGEMDQNLISHQGVFESDQFGQDHDSSDVSCNQEAIGLVDSRDPNREVVSSVPSQELIESNEGEQEVIDISSDSEGQDVSYRDHYKIADDGIKKSANRFIQLFSRNSSGGTKSGAGKSLLKVKNMAVASSVSNRSVVSSVQQSGPHSESIRSLAPVVAAYVSVPKVGFGSGPPALLPMPPDDTMASKLQPKPVPKTASEVVTPVQLNNVSNVNYFVVVTPPKSAPNNEKSLVQLGGAQKIQSVATVVTPANGGSSVVGNIRKGCLVKRLHEKKFTSDGWTEEMRVQILKKGRPCPKLEMTSDNDENKKHVLRTNEYYYRTIPWLTGSSELNKWVCWPCLLYCSNKVWSWDPKAFNRANLTLATDRHEITIEHLEAAVRLKTHELEIKKSSNVPVSLHHNETVRKNRHFFKLLVEVVCTVKKKLNNMYTSHVDCVELINLISCYDGDLKDYLLEKSQSSKNGPADLVSSYVGGVLASVETHIRAKIKSELDRAPFVCLILEDASDVVDKSWISVIVRYVDENGDICERFVKFMELGYERNAAAVVPLFKNIVTELDCGQKLLGFTYGGTLVEPPQTAVFNDRISSDYPTARFFHYKEHNLRKLICQALSHLKYTRGFFQCISDLSDFFECTPNAVKTFVTIDKDVYRDHSSPYFWDFSSGFILTVRDHYASIVKFLMRIIAWPSDWTSEATVQAPYFLNFLRKVQNRFFLVLIAKIFWAVNALTKAMEEKIDVDEWKLLAKRATVNLLQIKNYAFDETVELASSNSLTKDSVSDLLSSSEIKSPVYKDTFNEMIDYVATIINSRNKGAELSFISLDTFKSISDNEESHSKQRIIDRLLVNMKIDDFSKLKVQVHFFMNNKFFLNKSASQAIRCINEFKLLDTLPDLQKFLQLLITVPMISSDSLLKPKIKRVKTYVRGKMDLNSVDALMWIEKEMIDKVQEDREFYEDVIDVFAKNYAVIDSMYSKPALSRI